jgi:hypothetical protein
MHRLDINTYAGEAGENVTVTTRVEGGGKVTVRVDGQDIGEIRQFRLKPNSGDETQMRITLFGATGESCVVGISPVDGGSDGDLLLCQPHDPAPVHFYKFIVASAASLSALRTVRSRR